MLGDGGNAANGSLAWDTRSAGDAGQGVADRPGHGVRVCERRVCRGVGRTGWGAGTCCTGYAAGWAKWAGVADTLSTGTLWAGARGMWSCLAL